MAMSTAERARFFQQVYDAYNTEQRAMSEGQPHRRARSSTLQALVLHFKGSGRRIYVAEELAVMYPGQRTFTPDLLAVLDTPQPDPDDDKRMAWVVADEGKGPDFLLEVLHKGSRAKDLVKNVSDYAQFGIREYFIYDLMHHRLYGHSLPQGGGAYAEVKPGLGGRLASQVLGLNLGVVEERLRLFAGVSELANYEEYFERVSKLLAGIEARAIEAQERAEQAQERAEQAQERAEQAQETLEQERVLRATLTQEVRSAVLDLAEAYGLEIPDERRAQIAQAGLEELQALRLALKSRRAWP